MKGFIKYMRSEEAEYLLKYPNANHLFSVMAFRARRTDHPMNGLKAGQCFLGDYSSIGLTERQYRTAKKQLSEWNLATFKGTNKGTVGTIINSKVYDINEEDRDRQVTGKGRASDGQATTNKECKNEKNVRDTKRFAPPSLEEVLEYMNENGYPYQLEAEKFINYYESNGWKVGRNKMKCWKAANRNWTKKLAKIVPIKAIKAQVTQTANDAFDELREL